MSLEHKFCTGPQAVTVTDGQVISGYASLFGATDQGGDIVEAGAYRISLSKGRRIKMLWQHDPAQPIGVWDEVVEDAKGLWVRGRLLTDIARARRLSELDLWEVSLVTFPMLPEARVTAKAQARDTDDLDRLARAFAQARHLLPPL